MSIHAYSRKDYSTPPRKLTHTVILDVETCSGLDLKRVGAYRYFEDDTTMIVCAAVKVDDADVVTWDCTQEHSRTFPEWFEEQINTLVWSDVRLVAHNADFERLAMLHPHLHDIVSQVHWSCTMLRAAYWGLPMSLEQCADALNLPFGKDMQGRRLMLQMSRPRKDGTWWHETDPAKLKRLVDYCKSDVLVESVIDQLIPELPNPEMDYWFLDRCMNDTGLPIDVTRVRLLDQTAQAFLANYDEELKILTNGEITSVNQTAKIAKFCNVKSLAKDVLPTHLLAAKLIHERTCESIDYTRYKVLEIRHDASKTSLAKLGSMLDCYIDTGVGQMSEYSVHGVFQFYGASRTGRYAGRLIQPQNLPRPTHSRDEIEDAIEQLQNALIAGGAGTNLKIDLDLIVSALRSCIAPTEKYLVVQIDFSQIEARVLAWLAEQLDILQVFADGRDVYQFVADLFGGTRQEGKVAVLGLGYGMGPDKFHETCLSYGLNVDQHRTNNIHSFWRARNHKIVNYWRRCEKAAFHALEKKTTAAVGATAFRHVDHATYGELLQIILPSGRTLNYREPEIIDGQITFMGVNQYTRKWERISTYGAKLVENITQATARDLLMWLMKTGDGLGEERPETKAVLVGTVHDEIILLIDREWYEHDPYTHIKVFKYMLIDDQPPWANGLPLAIDVQVHERYGK